MEKGFGGVYAGGISLPEVKDAVESADLTILVGSIQSDFNTGGQYLSIVVLDVMMTMISRILVQDED